MLRPRLQLSIGVHAMQEVVSPIDVANMRGPVYLRHTGR